MRGQIFHTTVAKLSLPNHRNHVAFYSKRENGFVIFPWRLPCFVHLGICWCRQNQLCYKLSKCKICGSVSFKSVWTRVSGPSGISALGSKPSICYVNICHLLACFNAFVSTFQAQLFLTCCQILSPHLISPSRIVGFK